MNPTHIALLTAYGGVANGTLYLLRIEPPHHKQDALGKAVEQCCNENGVGAASNAEVYYYL